MLVQTMLIQFEGSLFEKNILARELMRHLSYEIDADQMEIFRDDGSTMDLGSTLGIILSASSVSVLAGGIAAWIRQRNQSSVLIEIDGKKLSLLDVNIGDAQSIIEGFLQSANRKID